MSKALGEIREQIDSIDNQVHDLLMQRASLVSSVAAAKKKDGLQIVQPAREARMMRRLLNRHHGTLPRMTIVRIWRELVSSVALLQTGFSVVVASSEKSNPYWDVAKDYFGSSIPMKKVSGTANALSEVQEYGDCFAVLPWPELGEEQPWWKHFLNQQSDGRLSIICALPYGKNKKDDVDSFERALVISDIEFLPSDDDVTFVGLELGSDVSRARILACAEQAGLKLVNIYSETNENQANAHKAHLLEVLGYWLDDDLELSSLNKAFDGKCYALQVLGGYPVVPDIRDTHCAKESAA
ncbi:MAG: chorismate mutase [Alphaproteobacteria bacterium]